MAVIFESASFSQTLTLASEINDGSSALTQSTAFNKSLTFGEGSGNNAIMDWYYVNDSVNALGTNTYDLSNLVGQYGATLETIAFTGIKIIYLLNTTAAFTSVLRIQPAAVNGWDAAIKNTTGIDINGGYAAGGGINSLLIWSLLEAYPVVENSSDQLEIEAYSGGGTKTYELFIGGDV